MPPLCLPPPLQATPPLHQSQHPPPPLLFQYLAWPHPPLPVPPHVSVIVVALIPFGHVSLSYHILDHHHHHLHHHHGLLHLSALYLYHTFCVVLSLTALSAPADLDLSRESSYAHPTTDHNPLWYLGLLDNLSIPKEMLVMHQCLPLQWPLESLEPIKGSLTKTS